MAKTFCDVAEQLILHKRYTKPGTLGDRRQPMTIQLDADFAVGCRCHQVADADFALGDQKCQSK